MTEQTLQSLYEAYLTEAHHAELAQKPTDGLFGFGKKAADDPCHDRFVVSLDNWLKKFADSTPDSATVRNALSFIYNAHAENRDYQSIYWVLIAVHGLTRNLVPLLNRDDASALLSEYTSAFPRYARLPVQKELLVALKKAANE
jgi:hypothetical protein